MESVFTITNNVIQASREAIDSAQKNTKALNRYTHIYRRFSSVLDIEEYVFLFYPLFEQYYDQTGYFKFQIGYGFYVVK